MSLSLFTYMNMHTQPLNDFHLHSDCWAVFVNWNDLFHFIHFYPLRHWLLPVSLQTSCVRIWLQVIDWIIFSSSYLSLCHHYIQTPEPISISPCTARWAAEENSISYLLCISRTWFTEFISCISLLRVHTFITGKLLYCQTDFLANNLLWKANPPF